MQLIQWARIRALVWVSLLTAGCLAVSAVAQNTTGAAGLLPGEEVVPMANCSAITKFDPKPTPENLSAYFSYVGQWAWTGQCLDGLLNGPVTRTDVMSGITMTTRANYIYGRDSGKSVTSDTNGTQTISYSAPSAGSVMLMNTDENFTPSFSSIALASRIQLTSANGEVADVWIDVGVCDHGGNGPGRCNGNKIETVYSVINASGADPLKWPTKFCPNPRTPVGCEGVWREVIAPLLPRARAVITAQAEYEAKLRTDAPALFAAWDTDYRAKQQAAEVAAAERAAKEASAAAEAARVAAADSARVAAAQAQADAAFQARLKSGNPGELFALADELKQSGQEDRARQALRALVSRFPNSPLAPVAAQQMAGAVPSAGTGTASAPRQKPAGKSCTAIMHEYSDLVNKTLASTSTSNPLEHGVWANHQFLRLANAVPACRGDSMVQTTQQTIAEYSQNCAKYPRPGGDCVNGTFMGGSPYDPAAKAQAEQALQQVISANQSGEPVATSSSGGAPTGCARTPDAELAAYNKEVADIRASNPMPTGSAHGVYQWTYMFAKDSLNRLEVRKVCLGPHYEANFQTLEGAWKSAKTGCEAVAAQGGDCPLAYKKN
ncbi:MAG: tetratricopeptide repeat protein [Verrucomicrobiaceae bacterium]|nr:MAG: tetratricopeptide repeat protein [Verrucomicrobiaceae bacterium]